MKDFQIELQTTADGSTTLYRPDMDEHYHSVKGALTESQHIFIDCGLRHLAKDSLRVLEIGFGSGLNALLSALQSDIRQHYHTLELYPLSKEIIDSTDYHKAVDNPQAPTLFAAIHAAEWNKAVRITPSFTLEKAECDYTDPATLFPQGIDVVYFDAFAPEKQPEMWAEEPLRRIFDAMNPGGVLTTYCAKGEIRRRLQSIGFVVERLAGPPGGKREILRATKPVIV